MTVREAMHKMRPTKVLAAKSNHYMLSVGIELTQHVVAQFR
jgi:hypothetical protein